VSGDFLSHPVGYFLEDLLKPLANTTVELIAYSNTTKIDALSERIYPYFKKWQLIATLSDRAAAELICSDGIHILIDLSGHTRHNRLPLFAYKAAPIQVTWLGYWATTGVQEMDYIFVDKVGVPEKNGAHFLEKVYYLPDTRLCFSKPKVYVPVSPLPALANGYITFGCFQNLSKLHDETLLVWAKIMAKLPGSRLRFQCKQLLNPEYCTDFYQRLANVGINKQQVSLQPSNTYRHYLTAHSEVDFILDTFPFTGGTTTCEALYMGVPTLTLAGDTLISRQGASLLSAAGLSNWIVDNHQDYCQKAHYFATHLDELAQLRSVLRTQVLKSPLFDTQRFAKHFVHALWEVWREKLTLRAN